MQRNGSKPSAYKKLFLISPGGDGGGFVKEAVVLLDGELQFDLKESNLYGPCSSVTVNQTGLYTASPLPSSHFVRKKSTMV